MNRHIIALLVISLFLITITAPAVESQSPNGWVILPDNNLYFVGERATVLVYGPENAFFSLNVQVKSNNTMITIMTYPTTTGPDGNATITIEFYKEQYDTATYLLNVTYNDAPVAQKAIDVVWDDARLQAIEDARQNDDLQRHDTLISNLQEMDVYILELIKGALLPLLLIALSLALFCTFIVLTRIIVPQQRWFNAQWENQAAANASIGKKMDRDIVSVQGASHPDIEDSEYQRVIRLLRDLGKSDSEIDATFRFETGNYAPTVKPVIWGCAGPYLILKTKLATRRALKEMKDEGHDLYVAARKIQNKMDKAVK